MSLWCIAFFVLLLLTLMLVYFVRVAITLQLATLKQFDAAGVLVVKMNGVTYTSFNAPANTLISADQTMLMTITSLTASTAITNKSGVVSLSFTANGYVSALPPSMNILSNLNLPVSPIKVPLSFTPTPNAVAGFSFKGLSVITSKSLNIDTAKFPSADSSLTAYTLTTNDYAYVL